MAGAAADLHVGISEIDREAGDLESARRHLETAAAIGERVPTTERRYRWFVAMGRIAAAEGDPPQAIALLDEAERLYRPGFFPDVRPIAAMRARIWIGQGDLPKADGWARERGVSTTDDVGYLSEFDHLTLVRLLIARHRAHPGTGVARPGRQRCWTGCTTPPRHRDAPGASSRSACCGPSHRTRGDSGRRRWSPSPGPGRGHRNRTATSGSSWTRAPRCGSCCATATRHDSAGDHARRLLGVGAPPGARSAAAPPAESLSDRELQVLRLLDSELSGPQIARELFVSHNTLRTHTKHIFTKLGVTSRRAAVRRARERGLM